MIKQTLKSDIIVRTIKLFDIGYSSAAYFIFAIITVLVLNRLSGPYITEDEEKKSTMRIMIDIVFRVWLIGVLAYIVRNIYHAMPWPLEGVHGYQHLRLKEVSESTIFVAFVVVLDVHLQEQVSALKKRLGIKTVGELELF